MAYTHHVFALECLPVLAVKVLLCRHFVAGLESAVGGVVLGKHPGWFLYGMGGLGNSQYQKDILILFQKVFFC